MQRVKTSGNPHRSNSTPVGVANQAVTHHRELAPWSNEGLSLWHLLSHPRIIVRFCGTELVLKREKTMQGETPLSVPVLL